MSPQPGLLEGRGGGHGKTRCEAELMMAERFTLSEVWDNSWRTKGHGCRLKKLIINVVFFKKQCQTFGSSSFSNQRIGGFFSF